MSLIVIAIVIYALAMFHTFLQNKLAGKFRFSTKLYSNGTEYFRTTVLMISIDGFKASYLTRKKVPYIFELTNSSLHAKSLIPSFPSLTFPNHYTLVTGLYPNDHGIVGNHFLDVKDNSTEFKHTSSISQKRHWWLGEPIWETVQKHKQLSAVHMWPGSDIEANNDLRNPYYLQKYANHFPLSKKVEQIIEYLDLPFKQRPTMLNFYVKDVDSIGHSKGTESIKTKLKLKEVDFMIKQLFSQLKKRNLENIVNVILVGDHGMSDVNPQSKVIILDDIIDLNKVRGPYISPLAGFVPKNQNETNQIYTKLKELSMKPNSHWKVYRREEVPSKYFYNSNRRIPPILCIQDPGYMFATRIQMIQGKHQIGLHGYDNFHPDMQTIFIAHGPKFKRKTVRPFLNTNIYNLMCYIMGITSASNNGTLDWGVILK